MIPLGAADVAEPIAVFVALHLARELDEERRRGREVVDHDAHVLHAFDRHALNGNGTTAPARAPLGADTSAGRRQTRVSEEPT
ncbi:MAG: hypothetical protein ACRD2W_03545 [Acidimicrobiales bacterium]